MPTLPTLSLLLSVTVLCKGFSSPLEHDLQGRRGGGDAEREKDKSAQVGLSKHSIKMLGPAEHKQEQRIDSGS